MKPMPGIPGTVSEGAARIRWIRGQDYDNPEYGIVGARTYTANVPDGLLKALVSQDEIEPGKKLWHLSVSHSDQDGKPDRLPTWDELKVAKYRLIQPDIVMVLVFPRRTARYLNIHPTTLHLMESADQSVEF